MEMIAFCIIKVEVVGFLVFGAGSDINTKTF